MAKMGDQASSFEKIPGSRKAALDVLAREINYVAVQLQTDNQAAALMVAVSRMTLTPAQLRKLQQTAK